MKRITIFAVVFVLLFSACQALSANGDHTGSSNNDLETLSPAEDTEVSDTKDTAIMEDISGIDWSVSELVVDGKRVVGFNYTNNSSFVIVDIELKFRPKEDTDLEALRNAFSKYIETYEITDDELEEIYVLGYNRKFADLGETVSSVPCAINGTYNIADSMDMLDIMNPDIMSIAYISSDNRIHYAYYDYKNEVLSTSDRTIELFQWTDSEFANSIPRPDASVINIRYDRDDYFSYSFYGASGDDFASYKSMCQESGFTNIQTDWEEHWGAINEDKGLEVNVWYDYQDEEVSVQLEPVD